MDTVLDGATAGAGAIVDAGTPAGSLAVPAGVPTARPKKTREQKLAEKREYARQRRAAEKVKAAKSGVPVDDATDDAPAGTPDDVPATLDDVPAKISKSHVKLCEEMISNGVAGLADTWALLYVGPDCPTLGTDRAELLGQVWGKYLAPYIDPSNPEWVGLTMAAISTAGIGVSYVREVQSWQAKQPKPSKQPSLSA